MLNVIYLYVEYIYIYKQCSPKFMGRGSVSGETHSGNVWRLPPNSREIRGGRGAGGGRSHKTYKNIYKF